MARTGKDPLFGVRERINPKLQDLTQPYLDSFNFAIGEGLALAIQDVDLEFQIKAGHNVRLWFEDLQLAKPTKRKTAHENLLPHEVHLQTRKISKFIYIF